LPNLFRGLEMAGIWAKQSAMSMCRTTQGPGFSARAATRLASRSGICENFSTVPQFLLQWFNF